MAKCKYFTPLKPEFRENCANCKRWNGKRCLDAHLLREQYEESQEFAYFDSLMRKNKPVEGPL